MKNFALSAVDNEAANFDFEELNSSAETAKANIANATSVADIKTEICNIWNKVGRYVKWAENIPVVGKFFAILADVLDSICG
ncbi:hypothetical protein KXD93_29415 [Mucilaginibacter sp. BJC16-A38]|uniref:hypothetical protein n=1 Tax=Mucilaginibacter phenanthrenivorans TaxID=1234842 RepID=UPI002157859C|nr:hypothetical protein [Mucilaginibacter phenanthrenivorans]MCR8561811.1 hypothetical protein [Mucilaginibacter phenanthrenivorans]